MLARGEVDRFNLAVRQIVGYRLSWFEGAGKIGEKTTTELSRFVAV